METRLLTIFIFVRDNEPIVTDPKFLGVVIDGVKS